MNDRTYATQRDYASDTPVRQDNFVRRWLVPLVLGTAGLVFLILLPKSVWYEGIISRLAEWQFNWLGDWYPLLTLLALVGLFALAIQLIAWLVGRLFGGKRQDTQLSALMAERQRAVRSSAVATRTMYAVALASALGSLVTLFLMFGLPSTQGTPQQIAVSQLGGEAPREGAASLTGTLDWQRMTRFDQNVLFTKRSVYFVPVVGQLGPQKAVRYLVQVFPNEFEVPNDRPHDSKPEDRQVWEMGRVTPKIAPPITGVLQAKGLPREITMLYRKAGITISPDHHVLYRNDSSVRWRHGVVAVEFLLFALGSLLVALLLHRQWRRVASVAV